MITRRVGLCSTAIISIMLGLAGCGAAPQPAVDAPAVAPAATVAATAAAMDHGNAGAHSGMTDSATPYDAQFIDGMIVHHQGAITMANQALKESERAEIKTLAQAVITAQEAEITQLQQWRKDWYPNVPSTDVTGMAMGTMELSSDTSIPFDQRFIDAMIDHHQGALEMAREALEMAEREEIKTLARAIITAQEAEIAQMRQWRFEWFGA